MAEIIIDDSCSTDITHDTQYSRGLVSRDYTKFPVEMFAPLTGIPDIDPSEYDARIDEQTAQESSLEHIWNRSGQICLSQNGFGYCWFHSTTQGVMMTRLANNEPRITLSAVGGASIVKKGKDEGGWCGESAAFARDHGIPLASAYPQDLGTEALNDGRHQAQIDSILKQSYAKYANTPETQASGQFNKISMDFTDLTRDVYDQNLTMRQMFSLLLQNVACPIDLNWWGHSVLATRMVRVAKGQYGIRILNSWWKGKNIPWGENGFATLTGSKMKPDQALGIIAVTAATE